MTARPVPWPAGHWLLGALPERMRLGADFYGEMARRHGDIAGFRLGNFRVVLLSHPEMVSHVLRERPDACSKGELFESLQVILGNGLFFSEGPQWRRQRRMLQPPFHPTNLARLLPTMASCVRTALPAFEAAVQGGTPLDLHVEMTKLTLDIAAQTLFGAALPEAARDRIGVRVDELSRLLDQRMFSLLGALPLWVPLPMNRRTVAAVRELDAIVYALIDARSQGQAQPPAAPADAPRDILGALLAARDPETGEALTRQELRDQVMTFFMAGHETTASALSWCFKLLAEHAQVAEKVQAEVDALDPEALASAEALGQLSYTTSVFKEAIRLYPPGWTLTRQALEDDVVGGFAIPRGTNLILCPYAMHRDERFFPEPLAFRPERFPLDPAGRSAYLPFGLGSRACIGGQFSTLESVLVLATLMRRYAFALVPGVSITADPLVTLRPRPGVTVTVTARKAA